MANAEGKYQDDMVRSQDWHAASRADTKEIIMQLQSTAKGQKTDLSTRTRILRRAIAVAIAVGVVAIAGLNVPGTVTAANEDGRRGCSNRTLRGDYGILVSGIRGLGPGQSESFVGTAIRTYQGNGHFTQIDNAYGELTGFQKDVPAYGTYEVHANCSGTSLIYFPGAPGPIETAFVIVAEGDEVKDAVMAPAPTLVTASLWRIGR
jgi:hypothetical protein